MDDETKKVFTANTSIAVTNKNRHNIERLLGIRIPPIKKKRSNK